ncbi:MAG: glucoamylase, partial [bacterium]|nr:glucoamylase [bacterium]
THIHAGNGPWIQYTAMLAQYYFYNGNLEKGNEILKTIDSYMSPEGYLCEHLTSPERFYEFKRLEWIPGRDYEKEFDPAILVPHTPYDNIVEELNHMKNAYENVENQCQQVGHGGYITFAIPLMWSHAEYGMALMLKTEKELAVP